MLRFFALPLLALVLTTSVAGQANDFEKIQSNLANRMKSYMNVPTEQSSVDVSTNSSQNVSSILPLSSTPSNIQVVSPVKLIRSRRAPQSSIYMPGSGPSMPDASSTASPQFGLGVTYSNMGTAKPTTSTANPAATWYKNWIDSLPEPIKRLYGATSTTASPQGLIGRRRRSLSSLVRRRRSAEGELTSTESSTVPTSASAEEEEVSTKRPCRHSHSSGRHMMEEVSTPSAEGSTEGMNSILRSKRSLSHIRDRIQTGIQNGIQNLFNGTLDSTEGSTEDESESDPSLTNILGQGEGLAGVEGLLSQSASEDSTGNPLHLIYFNTSSSPEVLEFTLSPSEILNSTESSASTNSTSMP